MTSSTVQFLAVLLAGVAVWYGLYAAVRAATAPARRPSAAPTGLLGDEPPAVVTLITNRWRLTGDGVQATLLDLASRRHVELSEPGGDRMRTTVRLTGAATGGLTPYEQRLLTRIAELAGGGAVPLAALVFSDEDRARTWHLRFRGEVVADARRRGLSRRRFGAAELTVLLIGAAAVGTGLAAAAVPFVRDGADPRAVPAAVLTGLALAAVALRYPGERHTAAGRRAAAHWAGVRRWLSAHRAVALLPPAAAAYGQRHLAYAAALGVAPGASTVLDVGVGDPCLVWSRHGGTWRRVRVGYPRRWPRYGRSWWRLAMTSVVRAGSGVALVAWHTEPRRWLMDVDPHLAADPCFDRIEPVLLASGVVLAAVGAYTLVRAIVDALSPRTVTGEVLRHQEWGSGDAPGETLSHLVVDDGTGGSTRAWILPSGVATRVGVGDVVRVRAHPWTRRIRTLTVVRRGARPTDPTGEVDVDAMLAEHADDLLAPRVIRASRWINRVGGWIGHVAGQ